MTRSKSAVSYDDLNRIIKAALQNGLNVSRISFDGKRLDVVIGEASETENDLRSKITEVPTL